MKHIKILQLVILVISLAVISGCGSSSIDDNDSGSGGNSGGNTTTWYYYELHNTVTVKNSLTGEPVESALVEVYYEGTSSPSISSCHSESRSSEYYTDTGGVADFYTGDYFKESCQPTNNRTAHIHVSKAGFYSSSESVTFPFWYTEWTKYGTLHASSLVHTMYLTPY